VGDGQAHEMSGQSPLMSGEPRSEVGRRE